MLSVSATLNSIQLGMTEKKTTILRASAMPPPSTKLNPFVMLKRIEYQYPVFQHKTINLGAYKNKTDGLSSGNKKKRVNETQIGCSSNYNVNHDSKHKAQRKRKLFFCPKCEQAFYTSRLLNLHVEICWKELMHCFICSKSYNGKAELVIHLQKHREQSQQHHPSAKVCLVCGLFDECHTLPDHWQKHIDANSAQCTVCRQVFLSSILLLHLQSHLDGKSNFFYCSSCQMTFTNKSLYNFHMHGHTSNIYTCLCKSCGLFFTNIDTLEQHVMLNHIDNNNVYKCQACNKIFPFLAHFEKHGGVCFNSNGGLSNRNGQSMTEAITNKLKVFHFKTLNFIIHQKEIETSDYNMMQQDDRDSLKEIETSDYNMMQQDDRDSLKVPILLRKEFRNENSIITYACQVCQDIHFSKESFIRHWQKHTGYNPNVCLTCNRKFPAIKKLKMHIFENHVLHPYRCSTCALNFAGPLIYERHILAHARNSNYFCSICGTGFCVFSVFEFHVFTCHVQGCHSIYKIDDHLLNSVVFKVE